MKSKSKEKTKYENYVTTVVLDTMELTRELAVQRIAHLDTGYGLVNGKLPKDHYGIYIRVIGEGHGSCYPEIMDGGGSDIILSPEDLLRFKDKLKVHCGE